MSDCPTFLKVQDNPRALGALKWALKVCMLTASNDDTPLDTSATAEGDSDDDNDGPFVAETVHDDNDEPLAFWFAGQH